MEGLGVGLALLVGHRPAGDVGLDADDRLDALRPGRLVEGDRAVEGAVVGDRHRIHAQLGRRVDQLGDPAEAVEQAELGVDVEVREVVGREGRHGRSMVVGRPRPACRRVAGLGPGAPAAQDPATGYGLRMLPADPTDDDIEGMVVDALERLPAPFRDQLGSVAIVIEDEATPEQLASVGAYGLYGLYQGIPRTRWSADGAPIAEQDHDLPTTTGPGEPDARTSGRGRRPTRSITRSLTTSASLTIGSTSSSGASPDPSPVGLVSARWRRRRWGGSAPPSARTARRSDGAHRSRPASGRWLRRVRCRRCRRTRPPARPRGAP